MDHSHTYLIVGLGLLGGKYAQVLSGKGYRVTGIDKDPAAVAWALEKEYICAGADQNFEDLVAGADRVIFGLYPTAFLDWVRQYGHLLRPGTLVTDVSGVKRGVVGPVQAMMPQGVEFIASHPMWISPPPTSSSPPPTRTPRKPSGGVPSWPGCWALPASPP